MPKVKLEVADAIKGLIVAPSFCPYFKTMPREYVGKSTAEWEPSLPENMHEPVNVVNASICALCKMCEFVQELDEEVSISNTDIDKMLKAIIAYQPLMESFAKQSHYLQRNDRVPMAAFLSFGTLQEIVYSAFQDIHREKVLNYFTSLESPLCIIANVPLYFNRLLTRSAVQVVGEVEWQ